MLVILFWVVVWELSGCNMWELVNGDTINDVTTVAF